MAAEGGRATLKKEHVDMLLTFAYGYDSRRCRKIAVRITSRTMPESSVHRLRQEPAKESTTKAATSTTIGMLATLKCAPYQKESYHDFEKSHDKMLRRDFFSPDEINIFGMSMNASL